MLELRQKARWVVQEVRNGKTLILTYRGKPAARLQPIATSKPLIADDPFYRLPTLAMKGPRSMTNREIDEVIYGARNLH